MPARPQAISHSELSGGAGCVIGVEHACHFYSVVSTGCAVGVWLWGTLRHSKLLYVILVGSAVCPGSRLEACILKRESSKRAYCSVVG